MSLVEYYLQYMTRLCEGEMAPPAKLSIHETQPEKRAVELQAAVAAIGIPEFVRLCADKEGVHIAQECYDAFDPAALAQALSALQTEPAEDEPAEEAPKQNAYEALLDCVCLDEKLTDYLIEILKTGDGLSFFKLSQVTVRKELKLEDFLYWFATKELYADETERGCVTVMDTALSRLFDEGEPALAAALLSGDKTTFELFRCEAPELRQLPIATYAWYEEYYLNRYYPLRFIMKARGIKFPEFSLEDKS